MTFIPNEEYYLKIAKGQIANHSKFRKFGRSSSITTTPSVISNSAPALAPYMPTTAVTTTVVSNDTTDTNTSGVGARKLYIEGLDASFNFQSEVINLNGITPVNAVNTYIRVTTAYITDCGTYGGNNVGEISIYSGANTFIRIAAAKGRSQTTHYCVPNGKTLYIMQIHFSIQSTKEVSFRLWQRQDANDVTTPFTAKQILQEYDGLINAIDFTYLECPFIVPAKTDVWVTGYTQSGTASASVEYPSILVTT